MIELWIKALHIIAVISWMAGMFYLPRLFVYHVDAPPGSAQSETFKIMERRLLKIIINPGDDRRLADRASGWPMPMASFSAPWLHAKLALVLVMSALHGYFVAYGEDFRRRQERPDRRASTGSSTKSRLC